MTHDEQPAFPVAVCSEADAQTDERPHPPTIARRPIRLPADPPHLIWPQLSGWTPRQSLALLHLKPRNYDHLTTAEEVLRE
jgi:hypothetical protein